MLGFQPAKSAAVMLYCSALSAELASPLTSYALPVTPSIAFVLSVDRFRLSWKNSCAISSANGFDLESSAQGCALTQLPDLHAALGEAVTGHFRIVVQEVALAGVVEVAQLFEDRI